MLTRNGWFETRFLWFSYVGSVGYRYGGGYTFWSVGVGVMGEEGEESKTGIWLAGD